MENESEGLLTLPEVAVRLGVSVAGGSPSAGRPFVTAPEERVKDVKDSPSPNATGLLDVISKSGGVTQPRDTGKPSHP